MIARAAAVQALCVVALLVSSCNKPDVRATASGASSTAVVPTAPSVTAPTQKTRAQADPLTQAFDAYLAGDLERAREYFSKVPSSKQAPKLRPGLPPDRAVTERWIVVKPGVTVSGAGLLTIERPGANAIRWRPIDRVHAVQALGATGNVVVSSGDVGRTRLLVIDARTLETRFETECRDPTSLAASPDGRWIAYLSPARELKLLDGASYSERGTLMVAPAQESVAQESMELEFSPDGTRLIAAAREGAVKSTAVLTLALFELPDQQLFERELTGEVRSDPCWAFSSDSRWLALADNDDRELQLIDTSSGKVLAQTPRCKAATSLEFLDDGTLYAADSPACRLKPPKLTSLPLPAKPPSPRASAGQALPPELEARVRQRFCHDAVSIFPSEMRPCGAG